MTEREKWWAALPLEARKKPKETRKPRDSEDFLTFSLGQGTRLALGVSR